MPPVIRRSRWEIGALARAPWRPVTPLPLDSAHYDCGRLVRRLPYRVHGSVCVAEKKPAASLCYFQSLQPAKKKTVGIRSLRLVSLVVQRFFNLRDHVSLLQAPYGAS
jgi:hypothetical protein